MSSTDRGRKRSLEVTGGPAQAAARSMLRAMGWTTEDLQLPQAGVAASWNRGHAVQHAPRRAGRGSRRRV